MACCCSTADRRTCAVVLKLHRGEGGRPENGLEIDGSAIPACGGVVSEKASSYLFQGEGCVGACWGKSAPLAALLLDNCR